MSISLTQTKSALAVNLTASFLAIGGTPAYTYSVLSGGAGGTIDAASGLYTAPSTVQDDPVKLYDTIQVIDSLGAIATSTILVGSALLLLCEILQRELGLDNAHVYLWDQKIFQPKDSSMYCVISVPSCKAFGNVNEAGINNGGDVDGSLSAQFINMLATIDIDIMSRSTAALNRKEEVLMAINSDYAQRQQNGNSFYIGRLPPNSRFINLSVIDGAAIPYRFRISVNMQYTVAKQGATDYFDTFQTTTVATNP